MGTVVQTVSDSIGDWIIKLPTPKADHQSHKLSVTTENDKVSLNNILLGEVWLASGQSNMEMPMKGFRYAKIHELVQGADEEIANANYPEIRMFTVKKILHLNPSTMWKHWAICSQKRLGNFRLLPIILEKII